jgi:alpha-glucosidase (family GH31 glycosyl hydrolase)
MMAWRFYEYLTEKATSGYDTDKRPFILTRSSFAGTGRFASHWLGDNFRDWSYMKHSVAGMMNMNMFGIPHVGADVCGFFG